MRGVLSLWLSVVLTGTATVPAAFAAGSGPALVDLALQLAPPASVIRLVEGSAALSTGKDGRLTFLLLGMDAYGLTDAISVMSINPKTGKMAAASFPRDTGQVRLPNGKVHKGRINSLVKKFTAQYGSRTRALDEFRKVIAFTMGVEIDHVAMLRFSSFLAMMDDIGPIKVKTIPAKDPSYASAAPLGVYFPPATDYELMAYAEPCRGWWKSEPNTGQPGYECHDVFVYARTRKGKGNSDFKRQARHVDIVYAAVRHKRDYGAARIAALVAKAQSQSDFYSSLPMTVGNATELYALLKKGHLAAQNRVVFAPTKYSTRLSGGAYRLKLAAVRAWVKRYFKTI